MGFWRSSIQTKLVVSMGAALLLSVVTVIGLYATAMNRQAEHDLVGQALPERVSAIRNNLERTLTAPVVAINGIANNPLVHQWLAEGEPASQASNYVAYLEAIRADQQALTTSIVTVICDRRNQS